jgi:hypothetical protein
MLIYWNMPIGNIEPVDGPQPEFAGQVLANDLGKGLGKKAECPVKWNFRAWWPGAGCRRGPRT